MAIGSEMEGSFYACIKTPPSSFYACIKTPFFFSDCYAFLVDCFSYTRLSSLQMIGAPPSHVVHFLAVFESSGLFLRKSLQRIASALHAKQ